METNCKPFTLLRPIFPQVIRALHRCFLYDTGAGGAARFLDDARFQRLLPPLVAHLGLRPPAALAAALEADGAADGASALEASLQLGAGAEGVAEGAAGSAAAAGLDAFGRAVVACLAQLAVTAGSDAQWKPLNHQVTARELCVVCTCQAYWRSSNSLLPRSTIQLGASTATLPLARPPAGADDDSIAGATHTPPGPGDGGSGARLGWSFVAGFHAFLPFMPGPARPCTNLPPITLLFLSSTQLVGRLSEEYLALLPETLPFLAELLEDAELAVEVSWLWLWRPQLVGRDPIGALAGLWWRWVLHAACADSSCPLRCPLEQARAQQLVRSLEALSGESLEQYLR